MLKWNAPEEQMRVASEQWKKHYTIACFLSFLVAYTLYDLRNGTIPENGSTLFFITLMAMISNLVAGVLWWPVAAWVSRVDLSSTIDAMQNPNANRVPVARFFNGWADNEVALDTFSIVSRVVLFAGIYFFLGPQVGVL